MMYGNVFNRNAAVWELNELAVHVKEVIAEIENGDYDEDGELSYSLGLEHLMDHLVRAWHYGQMTDGQINSLTQEEFGRLTRAIPQLNVSHRLVGPSDDVV